MIMKTHGFLAVAPWGGFGFFGVFPVAARMVMPGGESDKYGNTADDDPESDDDCNLRVRAPRLCGDGKDEGDYQENAGGLHVFIVSLPVLHL